MSDKAKQIIDVVLDSVLVERIFWFATTSQYKEQKAKLEAEIDKIINDPSKEKPVKVFTGSELLSPGLLKRILWMLVTVNSPMNTYAMDLSAFGQFTQPVTNKDMTQPGSQLPGY